MDTGWRYRIFIFSVALVLGGYSMALSGSKGKSPPPKATPGKAGKITRLENTSHSVTFFAKGTPNLLKIVGHSKNQCEGKIEKRAGSISCRFNFDTGMKLRDRHLREHLKADEFPTTHLDFHLKKKSNKFNGMLTLAGITKRIGGTYEKFPFRLRFKLDTLAFGLSKAKYLGVGVAPIVEIQTMVGEPDSSDSPIL